MMKSYPTLTFVAILSAAALDSVLACPYMDQLQQQQRQGGGEQQQHDNPHLDSSSIRRTNQRSLQSSEGSLFSLFWSFFLQFLNLGGGTSDDSTDGSEDAGGTTTTTATLTTRPTATPTTTPATATPTSSPTASPVTTTSSITVSEALNEARVEIESILDNDNDMAAKFVRLSFHDCVGGCDGCVDLSSPENFGLDEPIDALDGVVSRYATATTTTTITRADIWVLAGMTASEEAQTAGNGGGGGGGNNNNNAVVPFDMQFVGRAVCSDPRRGPVRALPSAHLATGGVLDFFADAFDFSTRDAVAILGAHTLGRAQSQNSGFDGDNGWVRNRNRMDNQFYRTLLDNGVIDGDFQQELQNNNNRDEFPNQYLWRQNNNRFMLNVDMALAIDVGDFVDPISGEVTCSLNGGGTVCPQAADTLGIANEYAESNTAWLNDFHSAFVKMTNTGCDTSGCTSV